MSLNISLQPISMFQEQYRRGEIQLPISVDILNVAMCYQLRAVLVPNVMFKLGWWRSVESSAGDDGDSPLVEVRLLLSSRQGKVHLKMPYCESTDNDDDSHSEEEIGPAGVEVHWQLYQ